MQRYLLELEPEPDEVPVSLEEPEPLVLLSVGLLGADPLVALSLELLGLEVLGLDELPVDAEPSRSLL